MNVLAPSNLCHSVTLLQAVPSLGCFFCCPQTVNSYRAACFLNHGYVSCISHRADTWLCGTEFEVKSQSMHTSDVASFLVCTYCVPAALMYDLINVHRSKYVLSTTQVWKQAQED